jgi:hypothetical protein
MSDKTYWANPLAPQPWHGTAGRGGTRWHKHNQGKCGTDFGFERAQLKNKAGETINVSNLATSIFEKKPSGWLMVYHHASRVPQ